MVGQLSVDVVDLALSQFLRGLVVGLDFVELDGELFVGAYQAPDVLGGLGVVALY